MRQIRALTDQAAAQQAAAAEQEQALLTRLRAAEQAAAEAADARRDAAGRAAAAEAALQAVRDAAAAAVQVCVCVVLGGQGLPAAHAVRVPQRPLSWLLANVPAACRRKVRACVRAWRQRSATAGRWRLSATQHRTAWPQHMRRTQQRQRCVCVCVCVRACT
jgi:hypothetical protein